MKKYEEIFTILKERATADPIFAEKLANPEKSHEGMTKYIDFRVCGIFQETMKQQGGKNLIRIDDEEIIGFAVHYYYEPEDVIKEEMKHQPSGRFSSMAYVGNLTDEQKAEIMENAQKRIMKAEEDKIVNATLGHTPKPKPEPKPKPAPKPKADDKQLSLF